jgi:hypothetical protein
VPKCIRQGPQESTPKELNFSRQNYSSTPMATEIVAYCSRAIPSSRAFITRFYDLIASVKVKKPYYMISINKAVRADVLIYFFVFKWGAQMYKARTTGINSKRVKFLKTKLFFHSDGH